MGLWKVKKHGSVCMCLRLWEVSVSEGSTVIVSHLSLCFTAEASIHSRIKAKVKGRGRLYTGYTGNDHRKVVAVLVPRK